MQKTLKNSVKLAGIGLHSGAAVNLQLLPAVANTGIVFRRIDLDPVVDIRVSPEKITEALLCSALVVGDVKVATIEHLMAAFAALEIDNVIVELDAAEVPVMDGSSADFVFAINSVGFVEQEFERHYIKVTNSVRIEEGDKFVELLPAEHGLSFEISVDFPHPVIAATPQTIEFDLTAAGFEKTVCRARTFGLASDLEKLHANNLGLGASLDNAIGIGDDKVLNSEGLRYKDEFVRHKLLDAIGDLYVAGPIIGKFRAHKPGHALNNQLLRRFLSLK